MFPSGIASSGLTVTFHPKVPDVKSPPLAVLLRLLVALLTVAWSVTPISLFCPFRLSDPDSTWR